MSAGRTLIAITHWLLVPPIALLGYHALSTFGGYVVLRAERGQPAPFDGQAAALLIRESAVRALHTVMRPLGWGRVAPTAQLRGPRTPVVLVPGIRRNRASMQFLKTFLVQRDFGVHVINHPRRDVGLADLAEALGTEIEAACKTADTDQIDLVGHSYGGLVAAWYVKHLDEAGRVRRLVTLGTPFGGTKMAVFGRDQVSAELLPASPMLASLAPLEVRTVCIWSPDDPVVVPSRAAVAEGAESVKLEGGGHVDMLSSSRAFRAVQAALSDMTEVA